MLRLQNAAACQLESLDDAERRITSRGVSGIEPNILATIGSIGLKDSCLKESYRRHACCRPQMHDAAVCGDEQVQARQYRRRVANS